MIKLFIYSMMLLSANLNSQNDYQSAKDFASAIARGEHAAAILEKYTNTEKIYLSEFIKIIDHYKKSVSQDARFEIYGYHDARARGLGYDLTSEETVNAYFIIFNESVQIPILLDERRKIISFVTVKKGKSLPVFLYDR